MKGRSTCPKRFTNLPGCPFGEEGNVPPISEEGRAGIARLLAKALNRNQQLILNDLSESDGGSLTSHLKSLSVRHSIPVSTLKLNARILKDLRLIETMDHHAFLSASGTDAVSLLSELKVRATRLQEVS